ncbi:YraN family protein [Aliiroseovarius sp. PTFE2010]|uniref:YraN family protein n=1 Tax=Aliiroseovarius sp. PTFE2010 TaxID=3417190 RepID=UPI003CFB3B79
MSRAARGRLGYHAGLSAEAIVEQDYLRRGYSLAQRRYRGPGGEIDLIVRGRDSVIFVEVKASKTHAQAAARVSARQAARIQTSASAFVANEPAGQLTDMRFDVALVDASGAIEILENAFM